MLVEGQLLEAGRKRNMGTRGASRRRKERILRIPGRGKGPEVSGGRKPVSRNPMNDRNTKNLAGSRWRSLWLEALG